MPQPISVFAVSFIFTSVSFKQTFGKHALFSRYGNHGYSPRECLV